MASRCHAVVAGLLVLAVGGVSVGQTPPPGTLIERTLAIVGGAVVTRSDVALAQALGLVDGAGSPETTLAALIDRWLMLHEVARFSPVEPAASAVETRLVGLRVRVGDDALIARALAASGRDSSYLAAWVRDDLRLAAYLQQRFASTGAPAEADIAAYAQTHAAGFAAEGLRGDDVLVVARTRLVDERRRALIRDWLADLRRRTPVTTFAAGR